ncbi:MAG TPA: hypothetical protein VKP65_09205 [Rhodothermales bacterium]|nr:hypothetical protein [Rhodothermales bacterium]
MNRFASLLILLAVVPFARAQDAVSLVPPSMPACEVASVEELPIVKPPEQVCKVW